LPRREDRSSRLDEIILGFQETLLRDAGEVVCPESDLPFPRERMRQALEDELKAGSPPLPPIRAKFLSAALFALEAFVPDDDAFIARRFLRAEAHPEIGSLADDERVRAQAILSRIQLAQGKRIALIRGEDWPGADQRFAYVIKRKPVKLGPPNQLVREVRRLLNSAESDRSGQLMGFVAIFALFIYVPVKVIAAHQNLFLLWRFWLFLGIVFWAGALGYPLAWLYDLLLRETDNPKLIRAGVALILALSVLFPVAIFEALFRLVVAPAINR